MEPEILPTLASGRPGVEPVLLPTFANPGPEPYCMRCGLSGDHWPGCPSRLCLLCHGELVIERDASPAEVDAGCELGVAYDPCPDCSSAATVAHSPTSKE